MVRPEQALGPRWQERLPLGRSLLGGVLAGLVAGGGMLLFAMVHSALAGEDFRLPPRLVAAAWYGSVALAQDGGVVLVGGATHLAISCLFGALFGVTFGRLRSARIGVAVGVLYAVIVWALITFAVLPWANEVLLAHVAAIPWWWLAYFLVFGALLGLSPSFAISFARVTRSPLVAEPKEMPI